MNTMQREMTGLDAEKLIRKHGPEYFIDPFANDARTLGDKPRNASIEHNHLFTTLGYIKAMIEDTHLSFRMITGSDYLPEALPDEFGKMCERLARINKQAYVIVLDGKGSAFRKQEEEFANLKIARAHSVGENSINHFMVSDGSKLREEKLHRPFSVIGSANQIEAEYHPNNPAIATMMETKFAVMWAKLNKGEDIDPKKRSQEQKRWWQRHWPTQK